MFEIDPRKKYTTEQNSLAIPTTSRTVFTPTTSALPTFNLLEQETILATTDSYQEVAAPPRDRQPPLEEQTSTLVKAAITPRLRFHIKEKKKKSTTTSSTERAHRLTQRRKGPVRFASESSEVSPRRSRPSNSDQAKKGLTLSTVRKASPYQRSRQRVRGEDRKEPDQQPQPYQSKVYGLPQVPSAGGDTEVKNVHTTYIEDAISHAEVTWSQDPFRRDPLEADGTNPSFDIDYSKDPSRAISQLRTNDKDLPNLFATKDAAANAINQFYKGSFVFEAPTSRPRILGSQRQVKQLEVTSRPSADATSFKLFDPFSVYRNL